MESSPSEHPYPDPTANGNTRGRSRPGTVDLVVPLAVSVCVLLFLGDVGRNQELVAARGAVGIEGAAVDAE